MKILLDENLPRKLVNALRAEGHEVESVHTLRMEGLDNGQLYRFALANFELCLTRDLDRGEGHHCELVENQLRVQRVKQR